jgi:hypothetical protein
MQTLLFDICNKPIDGWILPELHFREFVEATERK